MAKQMFGLASVRVGATEEPIREDDQITLPRGGELFPIVEGRQFLFRCAIADRQRSDFLSRDDEAQYWFGGTDESPFLTRLQQSAFRCFELGDETTFFQGLKPTLLRRLEDAWEIASVRQGDIFALKVPVNGWIELAQMRENVRREGSERPYVLWGGFQMEWGVWQLFGTRHHVKGIRAALSGLSIPCVGDVCWGEKFWSRLAGKAFTRWAYQAYNGSMPDGHVIDGELRAPDHKTVVLDGPHMVAQAVGLYSPKEAD